MYPTEDLTPIWVGQSKGAPKVWPVVIQHSNGYEPGVLCEIGGAIWREDVPFRLNFGEAIEWACNICNGPINGRSETKGYGT